MTNDVKLFVIRKYTLKNKGVLHPEQIKSKKWTITKADKDIEKEEFSFIAGTNAKWHSYSGKQFGHFLEI